MYQPASQLFAIFKAGILSPSLLAAGRYKTLAQNGQIVLNSMHKFQPRLHLVLMDGPTPVVMTDINQHKHKTWVFSQTVFTAVTAYQNQLVSTTSLTCQTSDLSPDPLSSLL